MTTYRGFNTVGTTFGSVQLSDIELVKRDLLNHFAIRKGEKLQNPGYGSSIHDVLNNQTESMMLSFNRQDGTVV